MFKHHLTSIAHFDSYVSFCPHVKPISPQKPTLQPTPAAPTLSRYDVIITSSDLPSSASACRQGHQLMGVTWPLTSSGTVTSSDAKLAGTRPETTPVAFKKLTCVCQEYISCYHISWSKWSKSGKTWAHRRNWYYIRDKTYNTKAYNAGNAGYRKVTDKTCSLRNLTKTYHRFYIFNNWLLWSWPTNLYKATTKIQSKRHHDTDWIKKPA